MGSPQGARRVELPTLARRRDHGLGGAVELAGQHRGDDLRVVDGEAERLGGVARKARDRRLGVDAKEREHRAGVFGVGQATHARRQEGVFGRDAPAIGIAPGARAGDHRRARQP